MKALITLLSAMALFLIPTGARTGHVDEMMPLIGQLRHVESWALVSDDVVATVYNAVLSQCNDDVAHTASMFPLNLDDIASNHVIAMERTMMAEYGIRYGDVVLVEGTSLYDGVWRVEDTMNRRFAGQHKIDILVPNYVRSGKWTGVKVYVPGNNLTETLARMKISERHSVP